MEPRFRVHRDAVDVLAHPIGELHLGLVLVPEVVEADLGGSTRRTRIRPLGNAVPVAVGEKPSVVKKVR